MRLPHAKPNKSSNVFRTGMNTDPNRRHSVCLFVCLFCWKGFWEATRGSHWDWDPTGCSIYNAFPTGKKKKLLRDAFTASLDYYPTPPIRFPQVLSAFGKVSKLFGSLGTVQRTGLGLASAVLWMKSASPSQVFLLDAVPSDLGLNQYPDPVGMSALFICHIYFLFSLYFHFGFSLPSSTPRILGSEMSAWHKVNHPRPWVCVCYLQNPQMNNFTGLFRGTTFTQRTRDAGINKRCWLVAS